MGIFHLYRRGIKLAPAIRHSSAFSAFHDTKSPQTQGRLHHMHFCCGSVFPSNSAASHPSLIDFPLVNLQTTPDSIEHPERAGIDRSLAALTTETFA